MILNLILSTIAFMAAVFFLNRYLDRQGMSKTLTRKVLVFSLAYGISVVASVVIDQATVAVYGEDQSAAASLLQGGDVTALLKELQAVSKH